MTGTLEKTDRKASHTTDEVGQLSQFLPYQLSVASNAVSALIAERYRNRFGLKIPEWRIMAVLGDLHTRETSAGMTQRALTDATVMDKVAVSRACKVLENRGLIERAPNAADGRSHMMVLTQEGRKIHQEVLPLALATEGEILDGFSESEQKRFRVMLEKLRHKVEDLS
ncbi:MAG: MarR family winged helix-turn-helix transcriptional regulator [Pseudomonadota bacterium]